MSDLVLLVTSRTVLRLRGEHELRVLPLPLPVPPAGGGRDAAELRAYASVNLFVERAYAAAPGFELTDYVLTGGERDLLERQRTLPNTLGWSVGLLSGDAQALFARLGVFPGPFTLSAVEAVAGDAGPTSWEPGGGEP